MNKILEESYNLKLNSPTTKSAHFRSNKPKLTETVDKAIKLVRATREETNIPVFLGIIKIQLLYKYM